VTASVSQLPRRRHGATGEILKLGAFLRRDFLIAASYRLSFVAEFVNVIVGVAMFSLVGRMVDLRVLPSYGGVQPTYMEYVATGLVLGAFVQIGVRRVTEAIEQEQTRGTLESLLITPTSAPTILVGNVVYDLVYVPIRTVLTLLVIVVVFGLRYQASGFPAAAVFLLLFIPFVWGVGMISAAMQLTFRRGAGVFTAFITLFTVGSGAYVPVSLLPGPAAQLAPYNPVGVASYGMRESLLAGGWSAVDGRLLALPILSAVALLAGIVILRLAMCRERRLGTIGLY
jgi:ABC-type polysaccharide/polyol phosphate export permease